MKKQIIIAATIFFLITGCNKSNISGDTVFTIEGTLYKDCSKKIMTNAIIEYVDDAVTGLGNGQNNGYNVLGKDTTDEFGNFKIKYQYNVKTQYNLHVNGSKTLLKVPSATNLNNLNVYYLSNCELNIKLNVTNSYSNQDTITIHNLLTGVGNLKVSGPFKSGLIYSVPKFEILTSYYQDLNNIIFDSSYIGYKLNNNVWQIKRFLAKDCGSVDATIEVN